MGKTIVLRPLLNQHADILKMSFMLMLAYPIEATNGTARAYISSIPFYCKNAVLEYYCDNTHAFILYDWINYYAVNHSFCFRMRRWTLRLWAELSCWLCWVSWKENWKPRMLSYMPSEWVRNDGISHSKPWPTTPKLTCFRITPIKRMWTNREAMYKQETEPAKTMAQEIFAFLCISFHQSSSCAAAQLPWYSGILNFHPFITQIWLHPIYCVFKCVYRVQKPSLNLSKNGAQTWLRIDGSSL